jgi:hypothetical protein
MHIHIEGMRIHLDEQEGDRMLPLHQGGVIALAQAVRDAGAFDGTAVQIRGLHLAIRAAHAWTADVAGHGHAMQRGFLDFEQT